MRNYTRLIVVPTTAEPVITPLDVLSFIFTFDVTSAVNSFPLVTTLTVDGVTDHLNASRITCLETNTGNSKMISVHILEPNSALESKLQFSQLIINTCMHIPNNSYNHCYEHEYY